MQGVYVIEHEFWRPPVHSSEKNGSFTRKYILIMNSLPSAAPYWALMDIKWETWRVTLQGVRQNVLIRLKLSKR